MTFSIRSAATVGAALLALGASIQGAAALPMAPLGASAGSVEQAAYLHPRYPGDNSRMARAYRHAHRNAPNRHCQKMPSRCR